VLIYLHVYIEFSEVTDQYQPTTGDSQMHMPPLIENDDSNLKVNYPTKLPVLICVILFLVTCWFMPRIETLTEHIQMARSISNTCTVLVTDNL
jgi:hypothetical protein